VPTYFLPEGATIKTNTVGLYVVGCTGYDEITPEIR
jgi:hypothetical protein